MNGTGDFESELERELHRILDPIAAAPIPLRRAPLSGGIMKRLFGGAGAALGAKLLTGFAVAALAVAGAGVTAEVATSGSLNPTEWGKQVVQQTNTCKDTLRATGMRGIGVCVSAFAKQHGKIVSGEHRNSDARTNDHGNNGKNKGNNGNHGKPSDTPGRP